MRRLPGLTRSFLIYAQATLLALTAPAAFGAAANAPFADTRRLASFERILFGQEKPGLSLESRLKAIETNLFGRTRAGTTASRLAAVEKLLGQESPSSFYPPVAPSLDRQVPAQAGPLVEASAPAHALQSAGQEAYASADDGATMSQALSAYSRGDLVLAESLFLKVISADPQNADAQFNLGAIAEGRADLESALNHYRNASAANPSDAEARQAVAQVEQQLKSRRQSEIASRRQAEERALEEARLNELKRLADAAASAYRNQRYEEAISSLDRIARQTPGDAEVQFGLAQAWRGQGDLARARYHLTQAISLSPSNQLYATTLADLDSQLSAPPVAYDQFGGQPGGGTAGDITPFEGVDTSPASTGSRSPLAGSLAGLLPALASGGLGTDIGLPGVGFNGIGGLSGRMPSVKVSRVLGGGLAGAAIGALAGRNSATGVKRGALQGAVYGGLAGLLLGGF